MTSSSSTDRSDRLFLAFITLIAAWLRFQYLGQPSLWWDEFITVGASLGPLSQMLPVLKHIGPSDINVELFPPLVHVVTHWLTLLGHNDTLMRLPGALAGVAAVPMLYLLCRRPLGRMTALSAALLMALSVYHMHYSREVRPYSIFMLENLLALHLLFEGLTRDRKRLLWGYGAVAAAMLYTSYMAATLIAAQTAFAGIFLLRAATTGNRREALSMGTVLGLALAGAGVLYLPWAQGQLNVFKLLHDPTFRANFNLDFIETALKEFAAFAYRGDFPIGWTFAAMGFAGCALALARGQRWFVLLLVAWAFMPIAGIFLAKARMELTSRYIFPLFILLIVFAAHLLALALSKLADALFGGERPIFFARMTVLTVLCILVSQPNLESMNEYYSRETSHYKELAAYVAANSDNADTLLFYNPRNHKLIMDWYGPDILSRARQLVPGGYHRALLLATRSMDAPAKFPQAAYAGRFDDVDILRLGLARTPVRPLIPGPDGVCVYSDDFSGFKMLEDAYAASNMVPSPNYKSLTRHDSGLPAWAVYRFRAAPGTAVSKVRLVAQFTTRLAAGIPPDDQVVLTVQPEGKPASVADRVTIESFKGPDGTLAAPNHEGKYGYTATLDLSESLAGASSFDLRLEFLNATHSWPIEFENIRLEAVLDGPQPPRAALPLALLDQLPVAAWTPGQDVVLSSVLHAFSLDGGVARSGVGSPADLEAYLASHPGDKPVRVLPYADGSPAVALFDPALAHPGMRLNPGESRTVTAAPPGAREIRALKLSGAFKNPVLTVGPQVLSLTMESPAPSELAVNPGGKAELVFSPLFTQDAFDHAAMAASDNLRRNGGEDCLSCTEDKPCSLTYAVRSGLPVERLRITAFPRVNSSPTGQTSVSTQISTGGGPWREVNRYSGSGSGRWEGWKIPQYSLVTLDKPARDVRIRFVLSGQKAQLWSAADARMRFELRLDASSLPAPVVTSWPATLSLTHGAPLNVVLLGKPLVFPDRLKRSR